MCRQGRAKRGSLSEQADQSGKLRAGHEGIPEGPGRLARQAGRLDRQAYKAGQEQGNTAGWSSLVGQAGRAC